MQVEKSQLTGSSDYVQVRIVGVELRSVFGVGCGEIRMRLVLGGKSLLEAGQMHGADPRGRRRLAQPRRTLPQSAHRRLLSQERPHLWRH